MDQCNDKLCKITKFQAKLIDDYIGSSSFFKAVKEILAARAMRIAGGCLYGIGGVLFLFIDSVAADPVKSIRLK